MLSPLELIDRMIPLHRTQFWGSRIGALAVSGCVGAVFDVGLFQIWVEMEDGFRIECLLLKELGWLSTSTTMKMRNPLDHVNY